MPRSSLPARPPGESVRVLYLPDDLLRAVGPPDVVVLPRQFEARLVAHVGLQSGEAEQAGVAGEHTVEVLGHRGVAALGGREPGDVERHHAGVDQRVAFGEVVGGGAAADRRGEETGHPAAVGVPGLDVAAARVEDVAPVLGAVAELRAVGGVAECAREGRQCEVGGVVFQLGGDAGVVMAAAIGAVGGQVAETVQVSVARPGVVGAARLMHHGVQRRGGVEAAGAEGVVVGEDGVGRIPDHDVGLGVVHRPLGQGAALTVVVDHRLRHVAGGVRRDHRRQLRLGAVDVPTGVVGVVGVACVEGRAWLGRTSVV